MLLPLFWMWRGRLETGGGQQYDRVRFVLHSVVASNHPKQEQDKMYFFLFKNRLLPSMLQQYGHIF